MSPRIQAIESLLEQRARRQFRVAVSFGAAIAILVAAVAYVLYSDYQQDQQIQAVSACADRPNSPECIRGHANSVAHTTHAEACFILAQGGIRCRKPLPEARVLKRQLVNLPDDFQYRALPDDQIASADQVAPMPDERDSSGADDPERPSVPLPPRKPTAPKPPTRPDAPSEPSPEPPAPAPTPAAPSTRPLVDLPDQLGVCVNALGVRVVC